ncbi:MAG: hypothetical protein LDL41_15420 [Coleofasciculus sp. S288]|nr:hypothetical protein [Coleofasciculus sp. S288]
MDAQLTTTEINSYRELLPGDDYQEALATLEKHNGKVYSSLEELWGKAIGQPQSYNLARLRQATLKQWRQDLCGDDSFRMKVQEYSKKPRSTPLLTGLIVYLVAMVGRGGIPIDPAIATVVVLYILKIGLNIFCEYTETSGKPPDDDPDSRRIPHD